MSNKESDSTSNDSRAWRRVVVKVGTNLLTAGTEHLSTRFIDEIVRQVAELRQRGVEVVITTSGAVAAGRELLNGQGTTLPKRGVANRQVLAALGQASLMNHYARSMSAAGILVGQALVSRDDLESGHGYLNARNALLGLINSNAVPVVNENDVVAVEELEGEVFGDNDRLSARIADVVDADTLIILSDVAGLFDQDPRSHPDATLIHEVDGITDEIRAMSGVAGSDRGRGGMTTKVEAAEIATHIGINVIIASGNDENVLLRLQAGESIGTYFKSQSTHVEGRKRRMLAASGRTGDQIIVNAGATTALVDKGSSLLPPGIVDVHGTFARGAFVEIADSDGDVIAAGRSNYSSDDIHAIKGLRSAEAHEKLDNDYGDEVVHRNNLVLMRMQTNTVRDN
ncbi:MAG: glutamate 5-kinase [Chloroflexi bacterium]|nr:glutamate 5-kinase [Chloroflexota bacterium]